MEFALSMIERWTPLLERSKADVWSGSKDVRMDYLVLEVDAEFGKVISSTRRGDEVPFPILALVVNRLKQLEKSPFEAPDQQTK